MKRNELYVQHASIRFSQSVGTFVHVSVCVCVFSCSIFSISLYWPFFQCFSPSICFFIHDGFYASFSTLLHSIPLSLTSLSRINSFTNMICFFTLRSNAMVYTPKNGYKEDQERNERTKNRISSNFVLSTMHFSYAFDVICSLSLFFFFSVQEWFQHT